jgi:ABC-type antimicrobial peptide transport system permease subunit
MIPAVMKKLDPNLPIEDLKSLPQQVRENVFLDRMIGTLSASFAVLATLLAAVGLYGVLSSVVRQRTSEIGIRKAFGAQSSSIFRLVIGQGLRMSAIGIAIGLVIAIATTRVMSSMLVDVRPTDPITFVVMVLVFLGIAAAACWLPARRAAGMDPNEALRQE